MWSAKICALVIANPFLLFHHKFSVVEPYRLPVIPLVQYQSRKSHKVTLMAGVLVVTLNFLLPLEDLEVQGRPLHALWSWLQGEAMQSACSRFSSPIEFVLVFVICQPQSYVLRISQ